MSKNNYNNLKNVSFDDNIVIHELEDTIDNKFFEVIRDRYEDIKFRGGDCTVIDYDGKKVNLKNAKIWLNNNGNYVKPKDYDICDFCSSIINFFR